MLFGRQWKVHNENEYGTDNLTLPSFRNARKTEKYMEAMALNTIVHEIMNEDSETCVVYSNDGSAQSITGNYVVQSLTINGVQRSLPTFGIISETKESLKDLQLATLNLLSASTGFKFTSKQILEKINFVMTDSTAHNIGVTDMVCAELDIAKIPGQLLCNVHPLMMIQNKIKELCIKIHDELGKKKIKDCFLVDVEFHSESFIVKALKCFSNFINKEYSGKPWNRSQHFSEFIKPKENMSISLKDHRFNRLNDCALSVLHHIEDIDLYLQTFTSITNGVAILDRGFLDIEILKPIFSAIVLIGIHVSRPYHVLLTDKETVYSTLLDSYPKLHQELISTSPCELLTTKQVLFFVSKDIFDRSLPKKILLQSLEVYINTYGNEIQLLLKILMKMIAEGFDHQKGAIFGFGENKSKETDKNVVKVCSLTKKEKDTLDENVQVHNLGEERNVGLVNYELSIRGKLNLESVSRKVVLKRAEDIVQSQSKTFMLFKKEAKCIEDVKVKWSAKMKELEKEGFEAKDALNVKKDASKLKDLEYLKNQQLPGPITSTEELKLLLESDLTEKQRQDRLYIEVRYAKTTCLSMNTQAANRFFRLRENGKKFSSQVYANCLFRYFDTSKAVAKVTIPDFVMSLGNIEDVLFKEPTTKEKKENKSVTVSIGEHVAVLWNVAGKYEWYLGLVDYVYEDSSISVSHFVQASRTNKLIWTIPDESDIHIVELEQIIMSNFRVSYLQSQRIRCALSKEVAKEIEASLKSFLGHQ